MAKICLREIGKEDVRIYSKWKEDPEVFGTYDEPSSSSFQALLDEYEKTKFLGERSGSLLIIDEVRTAVGFVDYSRHFEDTWIMWCSVFIAKPEIRGQGYGTMAHMCLTDYIFKRFRSIHKIELWTDTENYAEKRALDKAGFTHEGTLRARNRLRGEFRDMDVYGFLRTEWNPHEK